MQLSKIIDNESYFYENTSQEVVGLTGFEPVTPRLSSACSNQLSYRPIGIQDKKP